MTQPRPALDAKEAYRLWSATYGGGNVLSSFDALAVKILSTDRYSSLLDAACGTGGHLPEGRAVGIDLVFEMLAAGRRNTNGERRVAAADLLSLPFAAGAFDLVWCRLAAGYVPRLDALYGELARVLRELGSIVLTDLHPEAAKRGHVRNFQDAHGTWHEIAHAVHDVADHEREASAAGLEFEARLDLSVGPGTAHLFEAAGEGARAEKLMGQNVLLGYRFSRRPR